MAKRRLIDQLQAVALATRFLITQVPDADFREVWARLDEGRWWVSFATQAASPEEVGTAVALAWAAQRARGASP
jgi:L-lysine 2,3-aminomutase